MSSPRPSMAGSVKKVKVAGLLPQREWSVCTEEQEGKALYKKIIIFWPSSSLPGDMTLSRSHFRSTGHPRPAVEVV